MKLFKPTAIILISSALIWGQGQQKVTPEVQTTPTTTQVPQKAPIVPVESTQKVTVAQAVDSASVDVPKKKTFVRKKSTVSKNTLKVIAPMSFQLIMGDSVDVMGYAPATTKVTVGSVSVISDKKGIWQVKLATPKESGSQWIKVNAVTAGETLRQHVVYTKATKEQEKKPELIAKANKQKEQAKKKLQKLIKSTQVDESFSHYEKPETVYNVSMFKFFIDSSTYIMPTEYINYLTDALIGNEYFGVTPVPASAVSCEEYECAAEVVKKSGIDFFVLGKVAKKDSITLLSIELYDAYSDVAIEQLTISYNHFKGFDKKMKQLSQRLAIKLESLIEDVGKDEQDAKWEKGYFEAYTDHIKGTRLDSIVPDTLKKSESPYIIRKTLTIPEGSICVIEPGVQIFFGGQKTQLIVRGQLVAIASEDEPIRITSGRDIPRDDDWGKLVFANSNGNILSWVVIANADKGLEFINSSGTIQNTKILDTRSNSIHVVSSDISIYDSEIAGGALIGLLVDEYATVAVERSRFYNNVNSIAVNKYGDLQLKSSLVENNEKGMLLLSDIALVLNKVRIRKNQYGVISGSKIDLDNFDFNNNEVNFKLLDEGAIEKTIQTALFGEDTTQSLIVDAIKDVDKKLKLGIYSVKEEKELNILGNVGLGIENHIVMMEDVKGPKSYSYGDNQVAAPKTEYPNDKLQDGLAYNFSVYTALDYGDFVMEYSMDGRYDDWVADSEVKSIAHIDPISLKIGTKNHTIQVGDFNEVGGDISFAGRDILGARYLGKFGADEYNKPPLTLTLAYGEAQRPFNVGDRNPESFNEIIDSNSAVTQEMLLYTQAEIYTSNYSSITFGWVQSDNDRTGFKLGRDNILPESGLNDPVRSSHAAYWRGYWTNQKGTFEVNAEVVYGYSDTLNAAQINGSTSFMDYLDSRYSTDTDSTPEFNARRDYLDTMTTIIRERLVKGESIDSEDEFAAILFDPTNSDNPFNAATDTLLYKEYISKVGSEKSEDKWYESLSEGLRYNMAYRFGAEYFFPRASLAVDARVIGPNFYSPGSGNSVTANFRNYHVSYSQSISNNWNVDVDYNIDINNVSSRKYANMLGFSEGSTFGLQEQTTQTNAERPIYFHNITLGSDYRINSQFSVNGEYGFSYESQKDETSQVALSADPLIFKDPFFRSTSPLADTINYYGEKVAVDSYRYNQFTTAAPSILMDDFESKEIIHSLELGGVYDLNAANKFKLTLNLDLTFDEDEYYETDSLSIPDSVATQRIALDFTPETMDLLGYYPGGDDRIMYSVALEHIMKLQKYKLNNKFKIQPIWESITAKNEQSTELQISDKFSIKLMKNRVTLSLKAGFSVRTTDEDALRYYVVDTAAAPGVKNYHYVEGGDNAADVLFTTEQALSEEIPDSYKATGNNQTRVEGYTYTEEETDWFVSLIGKYNITSRMYTELTFRYDTFERPQALENQYSDLFTGLNFQYSF